MINHDDTTSTTSTTEDRFVLKFNILVVVSFVSLW